MERVSQNFNHRAPAYTPSTGYVTIRELPAVKQSKDDERRGLCQSPRQNARAIQQRPLVYSSGVNHPQTAWDRVMLEKETELMTRLATVAGQLVTLTSNKLTSEYAPLPLTVRPGAPKQQVHSSYRPSSQ